MTKVLKNLLTIKMKADGRLLNEEEVFDFYIERIMQNKGGCKLSPFKEYIRGKEINYFKEGYVELTLEELENRARSWWRNTLGSLVIGGFLNIQWENEKGE